MAPVGAGGAKPLLGQRPTGKRNEEKPAWHCNKCREAGPQGNKPNFGFRKFCDSCGISKGNCFGGNVPPAVAYTGI